MKTFWIIVIVIAICVMSWFAGRISTVNIIDTFSVEYGSPLKYPCGAITDKESLGQFGISNSIVANILGTNDFSQRTWIFSTLPIYQIRRMQGNDLLFLVPSNSPSDGKLYFAAVKGVFPMTVKMTEPKSR